MKTLLRSTMVLATFAMLLSGCARYQVTQPLEQSISQPAPITIGAIQDQLPPETPDKKKPTMENIEKFRTGLLKQLVKQKVAMESFSAEGDARKFEVRGSILAFKKGSGAVRFFIGFGLGDAKLTTQLELVETSTGTTVFAGNFTGQVSDWSQTTGDKMWENVAKDFAKALKKQEKNLAKIAKTKS